MDRREYLIRSYLHPFFLNTARIPNDQETALKLGGGIPNYTADLVKN
jgi:hypothetical protein